MVIIQHYSLAVILCVISMLCWGSWANTQKMVKDNWPFQLFYWNYPIGMVVFSLIAAFTLGSIGGSGHHFISSLAQASTAAIIQALIAGVIFNLSNILLVAAIDTAGMAVAFPIAVGLALIIGVLTNYFKDLAAHLLNNNAWFLFGGVAFVLAAIILTAIAYSRVEKRSGSTAKGIWISIVSGVLMGFFYRFLVASTSPIPSAPISGMLNIFSANFIFSVGVFLSNFAFNGIMMRKPLTGPKVALSAYWRGGARHWAGILGGIIWSIGLTFSLMAATSAGYAISYGLAQGATLVAALWGVVVWREFSGTSRGTRIIITWMFLCYILGLVSIILAHK